MKTFIQNIYNKAILNPAFLALIALAIMGCSQNQEQTVRTQNSGIQSDVAVIAVMQVVDHPALDATRKGIEDELKAMGYGSPERRMCWIYESAQGNPSLAAQISQKFLGEKPSVMIGIGTSAAQQLATITKRKDYLIPIVFSSVTDPLSARLVTDLNIPGGNVTGISNFIPIDPQLALFQEIMPDLKTLGIIYNPGEGNSVRLVEWYQAASKKYGITIETAVAENSSKVSGAARSLVSRVDALFVTNDNTALSAFSAIVKIANEAQIPVFASDTDRVSSGALAALGPNQYKLGRQTGKMVIQILEGADVSKLKVGFPEGIELYINSKEASILEIQFPDSVLNRADTIIN